MSSNFDKSIEIIEPMMNFILMTLKKLLIHVKKPWLELRSQTIEIVCGFITVTVINSLRDVRGVLISFFLGDGSKWIFFQKNSLRHFLALTFNLK